MAKITLTYFDADGGRGETPRLAMVIGGIPFEDKRINFEQWQTLKPQMPFQLVPVLEVDGKMLSHSNAINRYVGKLGGLYPEDPWQAALCDEIMGAVEHLEHQIVATFPLDDEGKKTAREALVKGPLPVYLNRMQEYLKERGGDYFIDNRLTVADLRVFVFLRMLQSGMLDHIPTDLAKQTAPLLAQFLERLSQHPKISEYYQSREK
jgi:glutathione S-transferase